MRELRSALLVFELFDVAGVAVTRQDTGQVLRLKVSIEGSLLLQLLGRVLKRGLRLLKGDASG